MGQPTVNLHDALCPPDDSAAPPASAARRCPFAPRAHARENEEPIALDSVRGGGVIVDSATAMELDPLNADEALAELPAMNVAADVHAIAQLARRIAPSIESARAMSAEEAAASMRDLGMLLSSLRRHDIEPMEAAPELAPLLVALGARTHMVPRDTVYHYGPWNPRGARQRTFTRDPDEVALIECVRMALPPLERVAATLLGLREIPPEDPIFVETCRDATALLGRMVDIIEFARRNVSVVFFARELRPYFEPFSVEGTRYFGPAAAHIPLCLVDHVLWASDFYDPTLASLQDETIHYGLPHWRHVYLTTRGQRSLHSILVDTALAHVDSPHSPKYQPQLRAMLDLFEVLVRFRGRHRAIAAKAYAPEVRLYPVGSGGYATPTLTHVLKLTIGCMNELTSLLSDRSEVQPELQPE